ncbi:hydroxypyruvate isomerase [Mycobacterium montefiorense]|uniref:Hydroxypyruvate isomerase n=1 Tax=Mycobacterium montefiorense TaxID=154654 RepID=A0AA37PXL6_9MYCO|nr:hydroxypyruvate isomerase [Mycobacterium montefiorense]GKU35854.1 hydroxypyruvate isomerase [Mycobacterium montefiorense]GKU40756.1 hydroxypyruvate isomerase [Mycobacterium montefiorense]GKU44295.1 hydroxypyruvate isomerase [Mycobacterium montefiorense]GKU51799.1 hydroxypyruvate isomerase [Mycobacterium montefiorense]
MAGATYTVNCSILFTDLAVLDRPAAARAAGFEAVEFWWPFIEATPPEADVRAFVRAIEKAGVQLSGLNFFAGYMAGGDRGVLSDPALTTDFRENVQVAVGIAESLGTRAFNALYGNRIEGIAPAVQDEVAAKNLAYAAQAAQRIGATVLIEPVSGAPRYPLETAADAVRIIDRVHAESGATNLRLLADLYHLYVNNDDVTAALLSNYERIGHVQVADAPDAGSREPVKSRWATISPYCWDVTTTATSAWNTSLLGPTRSTGCRPPSEVAAVSASSRCEH